MATTDKDYADNYALARVAFFSLTQAQKAKICNGECGGFDLQPDLVEAGVIFAKRGKAVMQTLTNVPASFGNHVAEEAVLIYIKDMWQGIDPITDPHFMSAVRTWRKVIAPELAMRNDFHT